MNENHLNNKIMCVDYIFFILVNAQPRFYLLKFNEVLRDSNEETLVSFYNTGNPTGFDVHISKIKTISLYPIRDLQFGE